MPEPEGEEQPQQAEQPTASAEEVLPLPPIFSTPPPPPSSIDPLPPSHDPGQETQTTTTTPPPSTADANVFQQSPNAAKEPDIAPQYEPQRELSQQEKEETVEEKGHEQHSAISTSTSTSTSTSPSSSTSPSAQKTTETTVATGQERSVGVPSVSTPPPSTNHEGSSILADQTPIKRAPEQEQEQDQSETMSNHSHTPGTPHPAMHYSPSTAYTASGISNPHYGYPNANPQAHEAYRTNPHAQTNNSMALPSMRTFDTAQQQLAMNSPVAPPSVTPQQPMSYYPQQIPMSNPYAGMTAAEAIAHQRYALPCGGAGAGLAGGRHNKKEIKRRTKTGCLTCRKRRIKCDELHPVCKNCQKSKRDCLGYDPVFKNQQQQQSSSSQTTRQQQTTSQSTPTQPSRRSATPTSKSPLPSAGSLISTPLTPNNNISSSYTTALPRIPSTATAATINHPVSNVKNEANSYQALNSSLDISSSMSTSLFPPTKPVIPHVVDCRVREPPHLRGGGPSFAPYYPVQSPPLERPPAYSGNSANKMKVSELIAIGGGSLPPSNPPLSQERSAEILSLYDQVYAPGLVKFFETEWFLQPQGPNALAANSTVQETMAAFLQAVTTTAIDNEASMAYAANLEFRVVWDLATLVYSTEYKIDTTSMLPAASDGSEARNRVTVFEALLSGEYLSHNPLRASIRNMDLSTTDEVTYRRNREVEFWYYLAEFLLIRDQHGIDATNQREQILSALRNLLDGRENRDVLYSLLIIRMLTHKFPADFEKTLPPHFDESDPKSKLAVARTFIQKEAEVSGGTTNVVRRFAELAVRAFISPGNNIDRR
ncbi:hypothetical protein F5Y16DRAFT_410876 [Xylariaceae sp. FL0255]|nr:hypothetical protein F5Y16DRAFT_410876 [Xylariaceae sp. FL0255]